MRMTTLRTAALIAASAILSVPAFASDFYWVPNDSNWHSWSDTANWTDTDGNPVAAAPGAGDVVKFQSRVEKMLVDLGGAAIVIDKLSCGNGKADIIAITNGTLTVTTEASKFSKESTLDIYAGGTLVFGSSATAEFGNNYTSSSETKRTAVTVHAAGLLDVEGTLRPRHLALTVEDGGSFRYGNTAKAQNGNTLAIWYMDNYGTLDWPNGFRKYYDGWSFLPYFRQYATGEWILGDVLTYSNNIWFRIELYGGRVVATNNVTFSLQDKTERGAYAKFMPHADITLDVSAGKTLDMATLTTKQVPFTYEPDADGTNYTKITRTGAGTLLLADVPYSLDLQGGTTTFAANTRTSMGSLKVAAGQAFTFANANTTLATLEGNNGTITIAAPGLAIGSLAAGATLDGTFTAPASAFSAGDVIATIPDATLRAKVKSDLENAGLGISENGNALVVGLPSFVFESATITDLSNPAGWTCGYVPVGKDVIVAGMGVEGVLSSTTPAFASITVKDGAMLTLGDGITISNITLTADAVLAVASGATATLSGTLSATATAQQIPVISVPSNAMLQVPGNFAFRNVSLSLFGTLATTTSGDLTLGYADAGETAYFALSASGATITTSAGNINFACPADGGTVAATGTWMLASTTFTHGSSYSFNLGYQNPASSAINIVFDNTILNYRNGDHYIEGGVHAIFRNGAQLYRNNASAGANVYVRGNATLEFQTGTLFQYGLSQLDGGVGNGRIDFSPTTDGHVALILDNAKMDVYHFEGNSKAVAEIRGTNLVTQSYDAWNRSHIFKGFKSVQLNAGAELVQSIGPDGGTNGGPTGSLIGNVVSVDQIGYFAGSGSFTFSNAIPAKTRTYNLKSSANTATGILRGTPDQNAIISVNTGANWAGTVVWDGGVSLAATEGAPFSYSFGGIRADTAFTFRLWEGGVCDTVNLTGEGWSGSAEPLFALQGGYDPVPGDCWMLGTIPVGTSTPALSSARWHFTTEAIDGDADNVRLVLTAASVDFTFNSTTTTDINDPTGWTCGYVPVGESVAITGRNVRVILDATNCIPAFTSISVRDGATLMVAETNSLPAIELRSGASLVVDGATAVLTALSTIAPGEGESLPGISILNGGTAVVPGGMGFKNISLRLEGGTLVNDGSGPLYLGTAIANESSVFGLVATNSTIATRNHTAIYFMTPTAGGAVTPIGDLALTNSVVNTGTGAIHFGVNNPTNIPFTVRFHGTDLAIGIDMVTDNSSAMTFAGAATVALSGGAHFYHCSPYSGQGGYFSPTFQQRGRMTLEGTGDSLPADFRYPFLGNGNSAIVSTPDEDGFVTQEFTGTRASIWTPVPNANNSSNGKAVWKIADSSFAYGMLAWWWQTQLPFHGLKAVEIADGTALTLVRRKLGSPWSDYGDTQIGSGDAAEDASGSYTLCLANVPFTGGGSVVVTNTYNRDFHVLVTCGANTATGTIAAYDTGAAYAGKTKVLFNDGANWAGPVVASDGVALVKNSAASLNDYFSDSGDPATVSFGGVRFDGNLTLRLWANGTADQVNFGTLGFSGPGGIAFAFQDGDEPNRGKWIIGTKPKSVAVPPTAARLWRISAKPIDETTDQLIASPVTGLFILVQ